MRLQALGRSHTGSGRSASGPLLLYDARCGVCRRYVSLLVRADRGGTISIAPLVGQHGDALRRDRPAFGGRDSAVWIPRNGPALAQGDAILAAFDHLGGIWSVVARVLRLVPRGLRNAAYRWFAGHRRHFAWLGVSELDSSVRARTLPDHLLEKSHDYRS